jgi:CheY-like chemotaxis protein
MRVLLADDDAARGKALAEICAACGHIVDRAPHGAAALELALERVPGIVLCPVDLPIIDGTRLAEILRGNPRTRSASFVFLVEDELDAPVSMDVRDRFVAAPWRDAEVLAQIEAILEREARYPETRPESEVAGRLAQISLGDLLQLFHVNRRSGTLRLVSEASASRQGGQKGIIELDAGQIAGAEAGTPGGVRIVGEKALFRMMAWPDGRFEFAPGAVSPKHRIERTTRVLLLEGMRQLDEWERIRPDLPPLETELRLRISRDKIPGVVHKLWREVLDAVVMNGNLRSVIDCCSSPDYQVLRAIHDLLRRGALAAERPAALPKDQAPETRSGDLLTELQLQQIRDWMDTQRTRPGQVLKVPVLPASRTALEQFLEALSACPGFARRRSLPLEASPLDSFGTLGEIRPVDGLALRLVAVSPDEGFAPLWDVVAHGALGTLVVLDPPVEAACEWVAPAAAALGARSGRPLVAVILGSFEPGGASGGRLASGVEALDAAPALQLRRGTSAERLAALRKIFARLVP